MKAFYKGFYKHAEALRKEVSTVAVMHNGKMLMGKRRDNGKWTAPGGHLEKGEDKLTGAVRELYEESGIKADPKDLKFLKTITNPENGYVVHGYRYDIPEKASTSMKNDPDGEVYRWHYMDPNKIKDEDLHVPREKGNVLLGGSHKVAARRVNYKAILRQIEDAVPQVTKSEKLMTMPFQKRKKRSDMEKEAFLKGLGKGLLAASLAAGSAGAKATTTASHSGTKALKAAYKEGKRHKDILKSKFFSKADKAKDVAHGSASAAPVLKEKNIAEKAYDAVRETDHKLKKNYGLHVEPNKIKKTFDGGEVSLKNLGQGASVNYKGLGADYHKGNLKLHGKINDNTKFEIDPKNKGVSVAWSKSF